MSTSKHLDKTCLVAAIIALLVTALFMNGERLGIQAASRSMGYETLLFDTSQVHTIDIVMDDWDSFIETCENEEYTLCSVVIDGEAYKKVAIRAKGNTSLSQVSSMNSDRYSFKIEFDHYDSGKTYHSLDKLSLNNIIQDYTYMKDYLTYQMMGAFGAASPLCSYAYITVNGEDWGLYLAVESIEESFLERNYGNDYGELYKPDSMDFGGGRGNGRDFNIDEFMESLEDSGIELPEFDFSGEGSMEFGGPDSGLTVPPGIENGFPSAPNGRSPEGFGGAPNIPDDLPDGMAGSGTPSFGGMASNEVTPDTDNTFQGKFNGGRKSGGNREFTGNDGFNGNRGFGDMGSFGGMEGGFGRGMGSSDVKLQYIDDGFDSYSNIFDSAKTDITDADKTRLIASLKALSNNDSADQVADIDAVIRYFVVHNFVVNGDSYTGSMIHNYYLYEKDGQLSMLPWDYNLAFGAFQGNSAQSAVNDPIDTPLSVTGNGDRPIIDWIFSSEEYTELYHQYFSHFLDTVDVISMIDDAAALIAPYVEKDPTKFYTYELFETGVETLKEFCRLRIESVRGQLDGSIPSTSSGQSADSSSLVDASHINMSDMGSMGMGGGMRGGDRGTMNGMGNDMIPPWNCFTGGSRSDTAASNDNRPNTAMPGDNGPDTAMPGDNRSGPAMPNDNGPDTSAPRDATPSNPTVRNKAGFQAFPGGPSSQTTAQTAGNTSTLLIISGLALLAGLTIAFAYKRQS